MCGLVVDTGSPISQATFDAALARIAHRGPDQSVQLALEAHIKLGFVRLAIMDTSDAGQQPFVDDHRSAYALCNGEIYNHQAMRELTADHEYRSGSDCEVLLPLYHRFGIEGLLARLDGEFAFVIYDQSKKRFFAARDPMGIRPLFYGFENESGAILFASEAKAIHSLCSEVYPFPPGHFYDGEGIRCYQDLGNIEGGIIASEAMALKHIRERFIEAVRKRLDADVPLGALLSGGLDSSLVCAIATKILGKPLTTFAVGLTEAPIDIKYARQVAEFIGSKHHEVYFTMDDVFPLLSDLIYQLETWDITTIRASVGMYLVCQYVRKNTPIRVLLTGEVSDELFGYKYTDFAPNPEAFQQESHKRISELYAYDVLRADRCIAAHGLEARVPFSDTDFVTAVMHVDPALKMNTKNMGKWLLRQAFVTEGLLPPSILWREKAAFSDAVGHGLVEQLKAHAEHRYSDAEFKVRAAQYGYKPPQSKEGLFYREIFEHHFSGRANWIPDLWLPNQTWENCNVTDPSARLLPNYGLSGS